MLFTFARHYYKTRVPILFEALLMPNRAALAAFFSSKSVAAVTPKRSALDFAFSASDSVFIDGTALLGSLCAMVS